MKTLVVLATLFCTLLVPANAGALSPNAEAGCKLLNSAMAPLMMEGDDFHDCNKQQSQYLHAQNMQMCMTYHTMEFNSRDGRPDGSRLPVVVYQKFQQGCAMLIFNISQEEYDKRCTSFCPRAQPHGSNE